MDQRNQTTTTTGAAHRGPASGFAFGRGPLLAPEDGGGSGGAGGGAAGSGTGAGDGQPGAAGTPPPAGTPKTFTQDEVNRLVGQSRNEGRQAGIREAREQQQQRSTPAPEGTSGAEPKPTVESLAARLEESEQRRAFDRRAARLGIDDAAADDLFILYRAQRPSDTDAWFSTKTQTLGLKGNVNNPNTNTSQPAGGPAADPKPPAAAPSSSQPNAVPPIVAGGLVDIYAGLTPETFAAMTPQQLREAHEKNVAAANARAGAPPIPRAPGTKR